MRNLSKTTVSEKATLIHKETIMEIQNWGWFVAGATCAIVAIALALQLFTVGGFWAWCWKLPVAVFATMAAVQFIDVGLNGDQPPR